MSAALLGLAFKAEAPSATAKLVLLKLVDHCDDEGRKIFPAVRSLAQAAQCDARTVQRHLGVFCTVGLLRRIREGGKGRGSTAHYEMDLGVLRLIAEKGWAAVAGVVVEQDDDDGEPCDSHAEIAEPRDAAEAPESAYPGMVSPLSEADRVTLSPVKGDTRVTQTLNSNPQESERERAEASESARQPANPGGHADGARLPGDGEHSPDGVAVPQLAEFVKAWPTSLADNRDLTASAWGELTIAERRVAIAEIGRFVDGCRRIGRTKIISGSSYLRGRKWLELPALQREVASGETVSVKPFSKSWWALWHHARAGRGGNARLLLQRADQGKEWSVRQGDVDAARPDALKAVPAHGEAASAFLASASRAGFHFPKFSESAWLFLPERSDAAVDDLNQAGGR